jgi:hypothetical protein
MKILPVICAKRPAQFRLARRVDQADLTKLHNALANMLCCFNVSAATARRSYFFGCTDVRSGSIPATYRCGSWDVAMLLRVADISWLPEIR